MKGISLIRSSPRAVATISSSILKPWVESCGANSSKRSRRIMKKPLMGSAILTRSTRFATSVARWLALARCLFKLSALPPSI